MAMPMMVFRRLLPNLARRALPVIALGLMLGACDRCGDFWSPFKNPPAGPHACREDAAPRQ
jgi:hypothetical protein